MIKNNLNIFIITFFSLFLYSCETAKEVLGGKKRSEQGDEFLVEKKNPLTEPPDMNTLPLPIDQEEAQSEKNNEDTLDIERTLNSVQSEDSNSNEENSLEKTILEKINN